MTPPINIGGDTVEAITIGGDSVSQVTVDGDTVFSAISDTSMFQDPIYQFSSSSGLGNPSDGDTISDWTDTISSLTATTSGSPTYRADDNGFAVVDYDSGEGHTTSTDSNIPPSGNGVSFAITFKYPSSDPGISFASIFGLDNVLLSINSQEIALWINNTNNNLQSGVSPSLDTYLTAGFRFDGNGNYAIFVNGNKEASNSPSTNPGDTTLFLNKVNPNGSGTSPENEVVDAVVSAASEPDSAFSDYHNDRL